MINHSRKGRVSSSKIDESSIMTRVWELSIPRKDWQDVPGDGITNAARSVEVCCKSFHPWFLVSNQAVHLVNQTKNLGEGRGEINGQNVSINLTAESCRLG